MNGPETLIALLTVMCLVALAAQRTRISYPIAFLLGGIVIGFIPHLPGLHIPPAYILVLFLPPLLMDAAVSTSFRDFRYNLQPILQLSCALVIVTCFAVAWLFERIIPGGGWVLGFVLGAIISPPDAVAASAIIRKLRVPKRIITILEGESLLNDVTGLVLYKLAVGAVVSGSFSLVTAASSFIWMATIGGLIGVALAGVFLRIFPYIKEPSVEIISTFLVPYVAYLLAELVHASGVLAVVCAGLMVGWFSPVVFQPHQRLPMESIWRMVTFLLNGIVFLLIGLSFPGVMHDLADMSFGRLLLDAAMVCAVTVAVRMAYVFGVSYGLPFLFPALRRKDGPPAWQNVFVIGWAGMRGVVSLATALALPLAVAGGEAFPHRSLIIFLAFSVILFTLVIQGLALPLILKMLPLRFNPDIVWEEWRARVAAAKDALAHVQSIEPEDKNAPSHAAWERVRSYYDYRLRSLGDGPYTPLAPTADQLVSSEHPLVLTEKKMWQQAIETERNTIIQMRHGFKIGDDIMHDIMRELDLMQSRFS